LDGPCNAERAACMMGQGCDAIRNKTTGCIW
jgi:hypothetical protein